MVGKRVVPTLLECFLISDEDIFRSRNIYMQLIYIKFRNPAIWLDSTFGGTKWLNEKTRL